MELDVKISKKPVLYSKEFYGEIDKCYEFYKEALLKRKERIIQRVGDKPTLNN